MKHLKNYKDYRIFENSDPYYIIISEFKDMLLNVFVEDKYSLKTMVYGDRSDDIYIDIWDKNNYNIDSETVIEIHKDVEAIIKYLKSNENINEIKISFLWLYRDTKKALIFRDSNIDIDEIKKGSNYSKISYSLQFDSDYEFEF